VKWLTFREHSRTLAQATGLSQDRQSWPEVAYTRAVPKRAGILIASLCVAGTTGCSTHHSTVAPRQQLTSVETICSHVSLLRPGQRKVAAGSNDGCVQAFARASGTIAVAARSPSRGHIVTRHAQDRVSTTVLLSLRTAPDGRIRAVCR
jgi:hypothetical protein